jgi:putative membrane protein
VRRARWLGAESRRRFAETVRAIEAQTSAEVVVTVRDRSASYRHVDFGVGVALAVATLLAYVYFPITFADDLAVPSVLLSLVAGVLLSSAFDAPKRAFVARRERHAMVAQAARAAFVDQGISATRARSGILVFVSLLENDLEIVTDIGIDIGGMGNPWTQAVTALQACARRGATPEELANVLLTIGPPLAAALPARDDDVNELPDEVRA